MLLKTYFGMSLVIYGLFKLMMGILALSLPIKYREKVQNIYIIRDFITMDLTTAGRFIDITIILFAMYSIIRGLVIAKSVKGKFFKLIVTSPKYTYVVYGILGLVLLCFYGIVVYSNWYTFLGISKNDQHDDTYKLSGMGSGIIFLITLLGIYFMNVHKRLELKELVFLVSIMTVLIFMLVEIISATLFTDSEKKNEIITMVMIPIGGGA